MKAFFVKHSYDMVKMFLNQFAIAVFGFVLALATSMADSPVLRNVTSVGAIIFYMFLLYSMTWDIGYADRVAVTSGKQQRNLWKGTLISLCANVTNFLFAIFIMLAQLLSVEALSNIGGFCASAALFLEGMFTGLLTNPVGGAPLNSYWFVYFLLPIPALLTSTVAYLAGLYDKKMTKLFNPLYPESDRDPSSRKRRRDD